MISNWIKRHYARENENVTVSVCCGCGYKCSYGQYDYAPEFPYCPNCGKQMFDDDEISRHQWKEEKEEREEALFVAGFQYIK